MTAGPGGVRSLRRSSRSEWARVLQAGGASIAAAGVVAGVLVAAQVRRSCADSNIYRLINLFCHHVRRTHPHLGDGLMLMAAAVIVGLTLAILGVKVGRRATPR